MNTPKFMAAVAFCATSVAYSQNIAESVYYLVHGKAITDQRPKGDTTSTTPVELKQSAG